MSAWAKDQVGVNLPNWDQNQVLVGLAERIHLSWLVARFADLGL
jgi:hypothetical protein